MAASSIAAARACARTLIFESLRIGAFRGAVPHVMLVVDRTPCVQQKVLVEGYRQVLDEHNGANTADAQARASLGELYIPLDPLAATPCGASGLATPEGASGSGSNYIDDSSPGDAGGTISYSVAPFHADVFTRDMERLQDLLRQCGDGADGVSDEAFEEKFMEVAPYLLPLPDEYHSVPAAADEDPTAAAPTGTPRPTRADMSAEEVRAFCRALHHGPRRELLGFILIERHAFQNELRQYRLRLALFNMGMRVVEHCHLESMSGPADALAAAGRHADAVADDQVCSYARACALHPEAAETLAKAIADSIDLQSWARGGAFPDTAAAADLPPPPAFRRCEENAQVRALLAAGSLSWSGCSGGVGGEAPEEWMTEPITGPGAPLRVVSRAADGDGDGTAPLTLTFSGGMEDCLVNTGHYAAAHQPERNDVASHRQRFPSAVAAADGGEGEGAEGAEGAPANGAGGVPAEATHGRLKKKEYLAMLRARGERPGKPSGGGRRRGSEAGSDADERQENTRARPTAAGEEGKQIGDSIGGTFPIGEVISESFDLSRLSGRCRVFAYPSAFKQVTQSEPRPFTMTIEEGCVVDVSDDCPAEFVDLLSLVRQVEGGKCYVRELGIGLNPFTGPQHVLADVTSFERQWGVHLSLGQRHPLFVKQRAKRNADGTVAEGVQVRGPVLKRKAGKYHIDVFVDAARIEMGALAVDFTKGVAVA